MSHVSSGPLLDSLQRTAIQYLLLAHYLPLKSSFLNLIGRLSSLPTINHMLSRRTSLDLHPDLPIDPIPCGKAPPYRPTEQRELAEAPPLAGLSFHISIGK